MLTKKWGRPEIELFASRHNYQFKPFVSWHADPNAFATYAMCLSWKDKYVHIFPPFSILSSVLQKLQEDQGRAVVMAPLWRTQVWFPKMCRMLISQPVTSIQGGILAAAATQQDQTPPVVAQTSTDGMSLVRTRLRQQKISTRACNIIMESWRTGSTKQYRVYLDKWTNFATARNENPVHPTVANVIDFLAHLYEQLLSN